MKQPYSRRSFMRQAVAGALIAGFDPHLRSWLTAEELSGRAWASDGFPQFDGQLLSDPQATSAAAQDFGHIIRRTPTAVLRPASVDDIVKLVRYARRHQIKIAARGQGHSTYGQPLVDGGVVVDMSTLNRIREIDTVSAPTSALVEAGVRWVDLLTHTVPLGYSPPTLTDFIELSVGGTLAVGGIGGQAFRSGTQSDNVLELEVVTGAGELRSCSAVQNPELFNACRAGLGQFGIIVGARVRLVPVPPLVRVYKARYSDLNTFMADQQLLIDQRRFDYVEGSAERKSMGQGWEYVIELAHYYSPLSPPYDGTLLAGLRYNAGSLSMEDKDYLSFANRIKVLVEALKLLGLWETAHPWIDLFLPASQAEQFISGVLANLLEQDTGPGPVLIYPINRAACRTPFFRTPEEQHFFLLAILRFPFSLPAEPSGALAGDQLLSPTAAHVEQLIQANRQLYEQCRALGGKRYPIDSVPMSQSDWKAHFQSLWGQFQSAKSRFDPDALLAPGQGIF